MIATAYKVVGRPRHAPYRPAGLRDFHLRETGQRPAGEILENPHIALYSLDFENRQAVFVETPADVNLSHAPFYFVTQFEEAKRVLTIPFDTMLQLAQSVSVDDTRLISIYSRSLWVYTCQPDLCSDTGCHQHLGTSRAVAASCRSQFQSIQ